MQPRHLFPLVLKLTLMQNRGKKNTANVELVKNTIGIPKLPDSFEGYKVLHISDLHFSDTDIFLPVLLGLIETIDYDICVLTGDYRYRSAGPFELAMEKLQQLVSSLNSEVVAILGNHDSIAKVPHMEAMGVQVLLNESMKIERGNSTLSLVGVDEPRYYKAHNIEKAMSRLDNAGNGVKLMLAHTPELYSEASELEFDAYLCGHTHGGQICLPGGIPVMRNSNSPTSTLSGSWEFNGMPGYTSRGAGSSIVEARFNCRPDIVLHTLSSAHQNKEG